MFPERDCLLSGQQSYTYSRLLYDDLTSFLGSACSSTLRPIQSKSKNDVSLKKYKKQQQQSKSALFPYISIYRDPYLYLYPQRYLSIQIEIWIKIDLDYPLSGQICPYERLGRSFFICFGHVRFRSEEEGLDLSILCREGCDLCQVHKIPQLLVFYDSPPNNEQVVRSF